MSQNGPKPTSLMTSLTKKQKIFSIQTRRLAESFESLNSSVAQSNGELLWSCKVVENSNVMCDFKV